MDLGPIAPTSAIDKALAAWAVALEALEPMAAVDGIAADGTVADARVATAQPPLTPSGATVLPHVGDGFVERLLGETAYPAVPVSEPALPGIDSDTGHESATVQTLTRPQTALSNAPAGADTAPAVGRAHRDFALPSALLVPVALSGLQVEPAMGWPLPRRLDPERPRSPRRRDAETFTPTRDDGSAPTNGDDSPAALKPHDHPTARSSADGVVFDDAEATAWCETLTRTLREALSDRIPAQALLAAADQWRRGRCVVLACPQTPDPAGPAWAFVLWPRPTLNLATPPAGASPALALFGLRVEARLQWHTLPPTTSWCHVRVVKDHHPRRGRQLVSPDIDPAAPAQSGALACEVQLGPVLARSLRWCEVRVHIQAAQRFWAALGPQWSVHVVVCALPLLAARNAARKATPC